MSTKPRQALTFGPLRLELQRAFYTGELDRPHLLQSSGRPPFRNACVRCLSPPPASPGLTALHAFPRVTLTFGALFPAS